MLALYTGKGVTPEVNLREHISCMPPQSSNKAEPTLALKEVQNGASMAQQKLKTKKQQKKNKH